MGPIVILIVVAALALVPVIRYLGKRDAVDVLYGNCGKCGDPNLNHGGKGHCDDCGRECM